MPESKVEQLENQLKHLQEDLNAAKEQLCACEADRHYEFFDMPNAVLAFQLPILAKYHDIHGESVMIDLRKISMIRRIDIGKLEEKDEKTTYISRIRVDGEWIDLLCHPKAIFANLREMFHFIRRQNLSDTPSAAAKAASELYKKVKDDSAVFAEMLTEKGAPQGALLTGILMGLSFERDRWSVDFIRRALGCVESPFDGEVRPELLQRLEKMKQLAQQTVAELTKQEEIKQAE